MTDAQYDEIRRFMAAQTSLLAMLVITSVKGSGDEVIDKMSAQVIKVIEDNNLCGYVT